MFLRRKVDFLLLCHISLLLGLQVIDPFPLITQEQKHGLKCHKHQKIEQGKGYNMILITPFGLKMSEGRFSLARSHIVFLKE